MRLILLIKKYYSFFLPYLLFLLVAGIFLLSNTRTETHIYLNQFLHPSFNSFFTYYTHFGDGLMLFAFALLLLFVKFRYAFFLGLTGMISGSITNLLKNFVYGHIERPYFFFKYRQSDYSLNLVLPEEAMNIHNSFPSGHTTGAFCMFVGLMLIQNKPKWGYFFFVFAILGGYSRVYLSQHFLVDIYFGSLIGTIISIIGWQVFENLNKKEKLNWWNKSLLNLKSK